MGLPCWALVPLAVAVAATILFVLDGLTFTAVLKPRGSPPVIRTWPLVGGMAQFLKGPMGLMANAMPKYGEVFTGASPIAGRMSLIAGRPPPGPPPHLPLLEATAASTPLRQPQIDKKLLPLFLGRTSFETFSLLHT